MKTAYDHLLGLGHRHIALMASEEFNPGASNRIAGCHADNRAGHITGAPDRFRNRLWPSGNRAGDASTATVRTGSTWFSGSGTRSSSMWTDSAGRCTRGADGSGNSSVPGGRGRRYAVRFPVGSGTSGDKYRRGSRTGLSAPSRSGVAATCRVASRGGVRQLSEQQRPHGARLERRTPRCHCKQGQENSCLHLIQKGHDFTSPPGETPQWE